MYNEYGTQIQDDNAYLDASGFWTGYVRFYGKFSNPFVNMYSGVQVHNDLFTPRQPNNLGRLLSDYNSNDRIQILQDSCGINHIFQR